MKQIHVKTYISIRLRVFDIGAMLIETLSGDFVCAYELEVGWYPCKKLHEKQWMQTDKIGNFDDDVMLEMMQVTSRYKNGYAPEGGE